MSMIIQYVYGPNNEYSYTKIDNLTCTPVNQPLTTTECDQAHAHSLLMRYYE